MSQSLRRKFGHVPVMLRESLEYLLSHRAGNHPRPVFVDATFGAGSFTIGIVEAVPDAVVFAVDRDPLAWQRAQHLRSLYPGRVVPVHAKHSNMVSALLGAGMERHEAVGIVFDAGTSALQLRDPTRGFSLRTDGPLDMRMGAANTNIDDMNCRAADELVHQLSARELSKAFRQHGGERHCDEIADAIVKYRQQNGKIRTTLQLAEVVKHAVPDYQKEVRSIRGQEYTLHPATRVFQALRIMVNEEDKEFAAGLKACRSLLAPGGRLVGLTFHSGEHRILNNTIHEASDGCQSRGQRPWLLPIRREHPLRVTVAEKSANPRARSARLRVAERLPLEDWEHKMPEDPTKKRRENRRDRKLKRLERELELSREISAVQEDLDLQMTVETTKKDSSVNTADHDDGEQHDSELSYLPPVARKMV
eukprot:Clim_evm56s201 gene=Clim_evmTU56s201